MAQGDGPLAFQEPVDDWVRETLPHALAFAISQCRNRDMAEDIVHDCYCRLLQKAGEYDLPRDGKKILIRAIANAVIDRLGRERVMLSLDLVPSADDGALRRPQKDGQPVEQAMAQELNDAIEDGLGKLPTVQRTALQMKSLGHSLDEIALTLKISSSNAGVLIFRARQAMARFLEAYREGDDR